jgi:aminopeptidase N
LLCTVFRPGTQILLLNAAFFMTQGISMADVSASTAYDAAPHAIYLKDYEAPAFRIEQVELAFDLDPAATRVRAKLSVVRDRQGAPLVLDGEKMELVSVAVDGRTLSAEEFEQTDSSLTISAIADKVGTRAEVETEVVINPSTNTALEGLYMSNGRFYTQCEAEGFRKITYFMDRPDVMARFRVRITAAKGPYPVLLSNGNLVEEGDTGNGHHWTVWEDPFPKPSYLFALVAGDLARLDDEFTTRSGRTVALHIHAEAKDLDKCGHAMESLKKSMAWDEEVYGLEYDLDVFNVVAVGDFNMGAMENKSLNIFNTKCVLAKAETATDADFAAVESVVAHEYFHNWTGNRVTCRDWFQLSLKEGLTVFRDQQFSADMGSAAVQRIGDVQMLRAHQFPEDAGPLAHPIRPDAYIEINNFYTATVYEKGAEVIRMMHRLLGAENFRKGMDLYFERHDGQAVTCEDFVTAMADASGVDLDQFRTWYAQAGTPRLKVERHWDADAGRYSLIIGQETAPTPGQPDKKPLHIPVSLGLLGRDGRALDFSVEGNEGGQTDESGTVTLNLREAVQTFHISGLEAEPVPSLLRGFSAPVWLDAGLGADDLRLLMANDADAFNRWEAGQKLATDRLLQMIKAIQAGNTATVPEADVEAFAALARDRDTDKALIAKALTLPGESFLAQCMDVVDVDAIHQARESFKRALAEALRPDFLRLYEENCSDAAYRFDEGEVARRSLRNLSLGYLMALEDDDATARAVAQFRGADNMTDEAAALVVLAHSNRPEKEEALAAFYDKWKDEDLVVDKWFSIQASAPGEAVFARIAELLEHPAFTLRNPNRVRSVVGVFSQQNQVRFHNADGRGYRFLGDQVAALNVINPQVAARLLTPLGRWQRFDKGRQDLMKAELKRLLSAGNLSPDVYEVVSKSLGD